MNKPIKPNITIPESFAANGVKADFDNNKILNGFDRIQPDVLAGDNLNKFIDDTYKVSNYALNLGDYVDEKADKTDLDAKVSKSGDTMTGSLTIKGIYGGHLQGVRPDLNFGDKPISQANVGGFRCYLNSVAESNIVSIIQGFVKTTNSQSSNGVQIIARKPDNSGWGGTITLETLADGTSYATAPTPTAGDNSTKIATTAFVKSVLSTSGNGFSTFSKGVNGYIKFANGIIIQWGEVSIAGNKTSVVTLPVAFTTANYQSSATSNSTSVGDEGNINLGNKTTTTMTVCNGTADTRTVMWIAIGY